MRLLDNIIQTAARWDMFSAGDTVIVGLSGGADSVSLLCALNELADTFGITLRAVHVNHGIRGEYALRDQRYCERLCDSIGIELDVFTEDIPSLAAEKCIGLEQCGRERRYELFDMTAKRFPDSKIATAHTLSDSCETVLFNLARGCGMAGLCGIPAVRGNIVRPLISSLRADTEQYCRENGIDYMTDETNADTAYSRNMIRHEIIPGFYRINPDFAGSVGRMTALISDELDYIERQADKLYEKALVPGGLSVEVLRGSDPALVRRVIRRVIREASGTEPEFRHTEILENLIREGKDGAVELNKSHTARVISGILKVTAASMQVRAEQWHMVLRPGTLELPNGRSAEISVIDRQKYDEYMKNFPKLFKKALDYDIIKDKFEKEYITIRNRRDGDKIALAGRRCTGKIKKLMCDAHIPQERRSAMALLECGGVILWLEDFGAAEGYQVTGRTGNVLLIELT